MRLLTWVFIMLTTLPALAADFVFEDIDGGQISLGDLRGKAVLVVNTASRCGFTSQYAGLQKLYDTYKDEGLEILAVPSGDFRQELKSEDMVKQFCEINYGLTIPMTT
ncbi:MAG: glutathione peroxidase, partial [Rhodobacteraceae bacterium]|nr:glutathione peroxidase [Paracoccaceae bacterium]